MRKILQFCGFLLFAVCITAKLDAQLPKLPKALIFGNFTYGNPTGDFKDVSNYGVGFELGGGIGFGKTMLIASTGQMRYHLPARNVPALGGSVPFPAEDWKFTPVKIGIRRYLLLGLFLNGNLGIAFQDNKTNYFLYEVGGGYKFGLFEVGAAYSGYDHSGAGYHNLNAFLLKAGLTIKI